MQNKCSILVTLSVVTALSIAFGQGSLPLARETRAVPRAWDGNALAELEVPLADPTHSPVHVSSDYYYKLPIRPVYKSYPVYPSGKEPPNYIEWLQQQEPEIVFDPADLKTESDWIRAGELVFDAPIRFAPLSDRTIRNSELYKAVHIPVSRDGTVPFLRYVVRKKGLVEVGDSSCGQCHTRVLEDGSIVKGAQGNYPGPQITAFRLRQRAASSGDNGAEILAQTRRAQKLNYGAPWINSDPADDFLRSIDELIGSWEAIPPGVLPREGSSRRYPPQIPDLIGLKDRRYLDHTGLVIQRSIADVMRYAALNQDAQFLSRYADFIPAGENFSQLQGSPIAQSRYSDEQLYALALYLYSLQPPDNPNKPSELSRRGEAVFQREVCGGCHTPPLYTNNKLTPVSGFVIPAEHGGKYDVLPVVVGTDPSLSMGTRRGTGYYKVPSLKGVWYRGPYEHNGSVATLEDWFNPDRLRDDYVPTGFKGYGVTTRAVIGHKFGLGLSADDRRGLIAFLRTL